jgi:hypothetical protein
MATPLLLTTTSSLVIKPWMVVARFVLAAWLNQAIVLVVTSCLVGVEELILIDGQAITKYYYKLLTYIKQLVVVARLA